MVLVQKPSVNQKISSHWQGMRQHGCTNFQIFGTSLFVPTDFEAFSTMCPELSLIEQTAPGDPNPNKCPDWNHLRSKKSCGQFLYKNNHSSKYIFFSFHHYYLLIIQELITKLQLYLFFFFVCLLFSMEQKSREFLDNFHTKTTTVPNISSFPFTIICR